METGSRTPDAVTNMFIWTSPNPLTLIYFKVVLCCLISESEGAAFSIADAEKNHTRNEIRPAADVRFKQIS